MCPALCVVVVYNIYRGFLTRKMTRVATIWIPLTASFCQELLEALWLAISWFTAFNCVPFISAIAVMSWNTVDIDLMPQMHRFCSNFFLLWNLTGNVKCCKLKAIILPLTKMEMCNMDDCMDFTCVGCLKCRQTDVHITHHRLPSLL